MTFIPVPNGMSLCFHFTQSGQNWQFCLTLRKGAGVPTSTDLDSVNAIAHTWATSLLLPQLNNAVTLVEVVTTDLTSQGAPQAIEAVGASGSGGSQLVPQNAAMVVSQRTALRGRSYRGRVYMGGLLYPSLASDVDYSSTPAANLASAFVTLDASLLAAGFSVGVASRSHNKVVTNPAAFNRVISYVVDQHIDSQRRRLFGRGK